MKTKILLLGTLFLSTVVSGQTDANRLEFDIKG